MINYCFLLILTKLRRWKLAKNVFLYLKKLSLLLAFITPVTYAVSDSFSMEKATAAKNLVNKPNPAQSKDVILDRALIDEESESPLLNKMQDPLKNKQLYSCTSQEGKFRAVGSSESFSLYSDTKRFLGTFQNNSMQWAKKEKDKYCLTIKTRKNDSVYDDCLNVMRTNAAEMRTAISCKRL